MPIFASCGQDRNPPRADPSATSTIPAFPPTPPPFFVPFIPFMVMIRDHEF